MQAGSTVAYLSIAMTKGLRIMLPPIELQNDFLSFTELTDKLKFIGQFDKISKCVLQFQRR